MSSDTFKRFVKIKARELALGMLVQKQYIVTKMAVYTYSKLKQQNYFHLIDAKMGTIFRFRTKMATFGDNFINNGASIVCPLRKKHNDSQALMNFIWTNLR